MRGAFEPVTPFALTERLAAWIAHDPATVRVAVDGPPCADPGELAEALVEPLRTLGRHTVHVHADGFWHDASIRLEHGREDPDSYARWLDDGTLRREVLDSAVGRGTYLPSLRDLTTNRTTRAVPREIAEGTVVLVSGGLLFGLGLPFDRTVHLAVSPAARRRLIPSTEQWTLAAFDDYDRDVQPAELADVTVRCDDPRHPAISALPPG